MSEFVLLYRTTEENRRAAMGTPELSQKSMQAWLEWMRGLEAKGQLKERGQPLDFGGKTIRGSKKTVTDGPYIESKDIVAGFSMIEAKDLAEAVEIARGCPMLAGEGVVEIRPVIKM